MKVDHSHNYRDILISAQSESSFGSYEKSQFFKEQTYDAQSYALFADYDYLMTKVDWTGIITDIWK